MVQFFKYPLRTNEDQGTDGSWSGLGRSPLKFLGEALPAHKRHVDQGEEQNKTVPNGESCPRSEWILDPIIGGAIAPKAGWYEFH